MTERMKLLYENSDSELHAERTPIFEPLQFCGQKFCDLSILLMRWLMAYRLRMPRQRSSDYQLLLPVTLFCRADRIQIR